MDGSTGHFVPIVSRSTSRTSLLYLPMQMIWGRRLEAQFRTVHQTWCNMTGVWRELVVGGVGLLVVLGKTCTEETGCRKLIVCNLKVQFQAIVYWCLGSLKGAIYVHWVAGNGKIVRIGLWLMLQKHMCLATFRWLPLTNPWKTNLNWFI